MRSLKTWPMFPVLIAVMVCAAGLPRPVGAQQTLGEIERLDPAWDALLPSGEKIEVLAKGFTWTEGPIWVPQKEGGYLLFSDIPRNSVFQWKADEGIRLFLCPSGYTGSTFYGGEPGSNGLLLDSQGQLVSCEHGDRRVSVLTKNGGKRTLVDNYQGFCGVYRLSKDGTLTLLTTEMTRPNGIGFSPDERTLYVAQSDPNAAIWKAFPVLEDGTLGKSRILFDATSWVPTRPGLPDGMAVDRDGHLWATAPGGVLVLTPEGKLLGRLNTGQRTANCTFGEDGKTLFITADSYLCRIRTNMTGAN